MVKIAENSKDFIKFVVNILDLEIISLKQGNNLNKLLK